MFKQSMRSSDLLRLFLASALATSVSTALLPAQTTVRPPAICPTPAPSAGYASRDSGSIRIVESWRPLQSNNPAFAQLTAQPSLVLGEASANPAVPQFGRIAAATRLSDGRIVVADGQAVEIHLFDAAGRAASTLGRRGQGPGEFQSIARLLRVPGDTIVVVEPRRLSHFAPNGRFIKATTIAGVPFEVPPARAGGRAMRGASFPSIVGRNADASWLGTVQQMQRGEARTHVRRSVRFVTRIDSTGARGDSILAADGPEVLTYVFPNGGLQTHPVPWATISAFAPSPQGFFESSGERYEVRERSPSGQITRIVRLCRPPAAMTNAEITAISNSVAGRETDPTEVRRMLDVLAWLPRPTVKPAFDQLLTDSRGRLWAREFSIPGEASTWQVFDNMGRNLVSVRVPARHELLEVGNDYVLTKVIDADNVETIRVYAIRGGAG